MGWVKSHEGKKCRELTKVALSFLDFKNKEIFCTYRPHLSISEFLLYLQYLNRKSPILLDIPLKGKVKDFFRPVEKVMQRIGLACRPSKEAIKKGRALLSKIDTLGFKAIEIYPYEFYKFYCLLPADKLKLKPTRNLRIDLSDFKRFFPPYKKAGERGLKNAEKIIKQLMYFLNLKLLIDRELMFKSQWMKWDIYDSLFGAIAGYLLLKHSPWIKLVKDKTGSEMLILSDVNLGRFFDIHTGFPKVNNIKGYFYPL